MKKLLLIIPILLLTGCLESVPVKRNFPEIPEDLKAACPALKQIEPTTKLSDVVRSVTDNYSTYHECHTKIDTWMEWYKTQKDIFEKANQ
jgi:hypothetical protein